MRTFTILFAFLFLIFTAFDANAQKSKKGKKTKAESGTNAVQPGSGKGESVNGQQTTAPLQSIQVSGDVAEAEAKGVGLTREDALQDALRNCVSQAAGVALSSETQVENYMVVKDAISAKTSGYITGYNILKEVPFPDRYEVTVHAKVSLSPMKADFSLLAKSVGGVRFMVMYDDRNLSAEQIAQYDYALNKVNEYLSQRGYRYIEKKRFDALKTESRGIMNDIKASQETYIQYLGMKADAQFILFIRNIGSNSRSEAFDTRTSAKTTIEIAAYDNCTAEGLGTVTLDSDWKSSYQTSAVNDGISEAVERGFNKLLVTFTSYIGNWANNGTPFELRFYHTGTYRDLRTLRTKLREDSNFGGEMEILSFDNYMKLNCTFKNKPDMLADKILDIADAIPELAAKKLDVKFIYGRQINFAPSNLTLEQLNLDKPQDAKPVENNGSESKTAPGTGKGNGTK